MKKDKKVNVRDLITRHQEISSRIGEIADQCEAEKRERTQEEDEEYHSLKREDQLLIMKMDVLSNASLRDVQNPNPDKVLRETLAGKQQVTVMLMRDLQMSSSLDGTGVIPIQEQEMLKPLRAGLIWDKVGLNIRSFLAGTELRWPKHGKAKARFLDEGERIEDGKIDFDKLNVTPRRLGCAIPLTRETLDDSQGVVEGVVREEMPAAIIDCVNEALFATSATYTDSKGKEQQRKVYGPFVKAAQNPMQFAGAVPTRRELLKIKSAVAKSGIKVIAPCWIMTEDMKTELEATPLDPGSGRFLCENDIVLGVPVYVTPEIGEGNIGYGDWSYQAAGFFGPISMTVDPFTLARQNATDFVLNTRFATTTLYEEAFVLGKVKAAEAGGGDQVETGDDQ